MPAPFRKANSANDGAEWWIADSVAALPLTHNPAIKAGDLAMIKPITSVPGDRYDTYIYKTGPNRWEKYIDSDGMPVVGYAIIQDEGIALPPQNTINFVGAGVTATNGPGGKTTVTIPGTNPGTNAVVYTTSYANLISTYPTGDTTKLYITEDNGSEYFWNGASYTKLLGQLDGLFIGKLLLTDKLVSNALVDVQTSETELFKLYFTSAGSEVRSLNMPNLTTLSGGEQNLVNGSPNILTVQLDALISVNNLYFSVNPLLQSVSCAALQGIGYLQIGTNPSLTSVNFPALVTVSSGVEIYDNPSLTAVALPSFTGGSLHIQNNTGLVIFNADVLSNIVSYFRVIQTGVAALSFSNLANIADAVDFNISQNSALLNVNLPSLSTIGVGGNFVISSNAVLETINLSALITSNADTMLISSPAELDMSSAVTLNSEVTIGYVTNTVLDLSALTTVKSLRFLYLDEATSINLSSLVSVTKVNGFYLTFSGCPDLEEINLPALTSIANGSGLSITNNPQLLTISHPNLTAVDNVEILNNVNLPSIDLSMFSTLSSLFISGNNFVTSINTSNLVDITGNFSISDEASITTLSFPLLVNMGSPYNNQGFWGNTSLFNISLPNISITHGFVHVYADNALSTACVDALLAKYAQLVVDGGISQGILNLGNNQGYNATVGTNSAPSGGPGNPDFNILMGQGITVIIA
jgi:hypothetical protein